MNVFAGIDEVLKRVGCEEGKNIDKMDVLKSIGSSVGLSEEEAGNVYNSASYTEDVIRDIQRAKQIGTVYLSL